MPLLLVHRYFNNVIMPRGYLKTEAKLVGLKKARGGSGRRNEKRKQFRGGSSRWNGYFLGLQRTTFHRRYRAKQIWWDKSDLQAEDDSEHERYCELTEDDFFNHDYCHQGCLIRDLSPQNHNSLEASLDEYGEDESQDSLVHVDAPATNSALSVSSSWCHQLSSASDASWDLMDDIDGNMEIVAQMQNFRDDNKDNTNETIGQQLSSQLEMIGHDRCCCICFQEKTLIQLMKRCQHPSACLDCLRQNYIVTANISDYPLKCFHHNCDRSVHDKQIRLLVDNAEELQGHYQRQTLAKARRKAVHPVKCPTCLKLRTCFDKDATRTIVSCENCHSQFRIQGAEMDATLEIFQLYPTSARCPSCQMLISKDGGCNHMTCLCGHEFDWQASRKLFFEEARQLRAACRIPQAIEAA